MDELKEERIARSRTYPASDERLKSSIHAEHVRLDINFSGSNESFTPSAAEYNEIRATFSQLNDAKDRIDFAK